MIELKVLVEGKFDAAWIETLLVRVFDRSDLLVSAQPCGRKRDVLEKFAEPERGRRVLINELHTIALIDADTPSVADARSSAQRLLRRLSPQSEELASRVFFAVPEIEAWLFADVQTALRFAKRGVGAVNRVEFADEIPMAKQFAARTFGRKELEEVGLAIAAHMNIEIALSRSSSLRDFLAGVGRVIGDPRFQGLPDAYRMLGPRLLGSLVRETNKSDSVIYRTLDGQQVTAAELANAIAEGSSLAKEYASDLLRVARDQLAREARRGGRN